MLQSWKEYIEKTKNIRPRPTLVEAVSLVSGKEEALDLGAGAMNDVRHLLASGFKHVTAVDIVAPDQGMLKGFPEGSVEYVVSSFDHFDFLAGEYDLVNAQFSLPFNPQVTFNAVFSKAMASLKLGGIFVGTLFGERDEWNKPGTELVFHTSEQVKSLLAPLEIVKLSEEEKEGKTALGKPKRWHIFHFIARKR